MAWGGDQSDGKKMDENNGQECFLKVEPPTGGDHRDRERWHSRHATNRSWRESLGRHTRWVVHPLAVEHVKDRDEQLASGGDDRNLVVLLALQTSIESAEIRIIHLITATFAQRIQRNGLLPSFEIPPSVRLSPDSLTTGSRPA